MEGTVWLWSQYTHRCFFFSLLICQTWLTGFSLWYTGINPSSDQNKHWINANPLIVIMKGYVGYGGSLACCLPMRNRPAGFISGTSLVFTSIVIAAVITKNNVVLICAIIFGGNKSLYRTETVKCAHIWMLHRLQIQIALKMCAAFFSL